MTRLYDIMLEHGVSGVGANASKIDSISTSPYSVIAIWRYKHPVTYSRKKGESFSKDPMDAVLTLSEPLVIVDDIRDVSVSSNKDSYVGHLQANLHPSVNYFYEVYPGDFICCWIVNSLDLMTDLVSRIKKEETCNNFLDGLKFIGKVTGIRKNINQSASGVRASSYSIGAASFTELDASIYFDPHLADGESRPATSWLKTTGINISKIIQDGGLNYINLNDIMPVLLSAFYGKGVPKNYGVDSNLSITAGLDNPNAMIVPNPIGKILGVPYGTKANGAYAYTDILEFIHGIQKYQISSTNSDFVLRQKNTKSGSALALNQEVSGIFTPDKIGFAEDERRRFTGNKCLASFQPTVAQFNGQRTVWSILQQYLNPTINEMYACLRSNGAGRVFPTLTVRQLPFTSGLLPGTYTPKVVVGANEVAAPKTSDFSKGTDSKIGQDTAQNQTETLTRDSQRQLTLTRFSELPRWVAHPVLVKVMDLGRSDAPRVNFVHITSDSGNIANGLARDPPAVDDLDMYRNGLRPYIASVPASNDDIANRLVGDWMYILSDILMGQSLHLTGQIQLLGIQAPICPGDNFEFDEHIFHIESVSHNFSIQANGIKSFSTLLALSHGVRAEQLGSDDLSLFTGASPNDLTHYEAPATADYGIQNNENSGRSRNELGALNNPLTGPLGDFSGNNGGNV